MLQLPAIFLVFTFNQYIYFQSIYLLSINIFESKPVEISGYFNMTFRDTMENWQSEFLQLIWQVAGLSLLWYVGSPQSKEGDERKEEKMDIIIEMLDPDELHMKLKIKYFK